MADREYRILITGSRDFDNPGLLTYELALAAGKSGLPRNEVVIVHGACPTGADAQAAGFAAMHGYRTEEHPADWQQGKSAGPRRNAAMVALGADVCLALFQPGAASRGTSDCVRKALDAGIPVRAFGEVPGWVKAAGDVSATPRGGE
jgi:hypothetical protein